MLSAVITCFGLSILLRADSLWVHPLAAALAISAKFVLRIHGKHLYNPANLGVILAISLFPGAWISPGQWGQDVALAVWFVVLGGVVVNRAQPLRHRVDIPGAPTSASSRCASTALGQPWTIFVHQFSNGGLLLFAFFMISDPMTIPNRHGRAHRLRDRRRDRRVPVALRAVQAERARVGAVLLHAAGARSSTACGQREKFEWRRRG